MLKSDDTHWCGVTGPGLRSAVRGLHPSRIMIFFTVLLFKGQINWGTFHGLQSRLPYKRCLMHMCQAR